MLQTPTTAIDNEDRERFSRDGFIVKNDLLSAGAIEEVKCCFSSWVRTYGPNRALAEFIPAKEGKISGGAQIRKWGTDFMFQLENGREPEFDDLDKLELQVRKFMSFQEEAPVFREMLSSSGPLLPIVEDLLEDTAILFQTMALIKPPKIGATKPWHQDNAYFSVTPLEAVIGVWVAVDEATTQNGCMHMLRGLHRTGPYRHEHNRDCEINARRLDLSTLEPVPLRPGGVLFFSGMVPHETPPNRSDHRRRALQFHFRGSKSEILPGPDYDEVFKDSDGRPASCAAIRREGV